MQLGALITYPEQHLTGQAAEIPVLLPGRQFISGQGLQSHPRAAPPAVQAAPRLLASHLSLQLPHQAGKV